MRKFTLVRLVLTVKNKNKYEEKGPKSIRNAKKTNEIFLRENASGPFY